MLGFDFGVICLFCGTMWLILLNGLRLFRCLFVRFVVLFVGLAGWV